MFPVNCDVADTLSSGAPRHLHIFPLSPSLFPAKIFAEGDTCHFVLCTLHSKSRSGKISETAFLSFIICHSPNEALRGS